MDMIAEGQQQGSLLAVADEIRRLSSSESDHKAELGQYFTPVAVAKFMASLFSDLSRTDSLRLLDSGAGTGILTAAVIERYLLKGTHYADSFIELYEIDSNVVALLQETLSECVRRWSAKGATMRVDLLDRDFIERAVETIRGGLFSSKDDNRSFNRIILNPPYKKLSTASRERKLLNSIGLGTSNLYTAFLLLACELLEDNGELVAITPRSFCNGPYFLPFRKKFLEKMSFTRIHVFESRSSVFGEDGVLQENIIFHAKKSPSLRNISISSSHDADPGTMSVREVATEQVVHPGDASMIINIATNDHDQLIVDRMSTFKSDLVELGVSVSTGRVVDFRVRSLLSESANHQNFPLLYPVHLDHGTVRWPVDGKKAWNSLKQSENDEKLVVPAGSYVLVKRFSSKEERRRIVASYCKTSEFSDRSIGIENHLNYFHLNNRGLQDWLAKGISVYLNSTLVDIYFRRFSGHTQVNATDLRSLPYPNLDQLKILSELVPDDGYPSQKQIDAQIGEMTEMGAKQNPVEAKHKVGESLEVLRTIGIPKAQQNERSALTLLALLDLEPAADWSEASNPMIGITPIMDWCKTHYGRSYAPNTRETFRRQTVHQFLEAGLIVQNPDDPVRAVNSPRSVYQISPEALKLFKSFGTSRWKSRFAKFSSQQGTLIKKYAKERKLNQIPLAVKDGVTIRLTPGAHSELIKDVISEFGPRFTPGAQVVYVGDTGDKSAYFNERLAKSLNLAVDHHGKMPDAILYFRRKKWLVLVEAVTSHGPVDPKRHGELSELFADVNVGLVFLTAFNSRKLAAKYFTEISWETEVWTSDAPDHLIHFNGERFLGPY